jgi:hypothetical protein
VEVVKGFVAFLITFGLAGWLLGLAAIPERRSGFERLFLSLALAVPATVLVAAPGLIARRQGTWSLLACLAVLAAVAAWRTGHPFARLVDAARAAPARWRETGWPARLLVALALVATWFAVLEPQGAADLSDAEPNGTIVYYHWGVVQRIAEDGEVPATLPEWGEPRPFPFEYLASAMHGAATSTLAGSADFAMSERYRLALVVFALFALLALWRRWLPLWWAWLAAVLTLNVSRVDTRLLVYKPEAVAFVLVLWSAWLFDVALERRSGRWGALAGIVLATAFLAHPIGSLLAVPLWLGILVARVRPRLSLRTAAIAFLVFVVAFGTTRTLVGSTEQDLSQERTGDRDPTREIYALAYISERPRSADALRLPDCADFFGVQTTTRPFLAANASWLSFDLSRPGPVVLLAGVLLAGAGAALLAGGPASQRARRGVVTWAVFALGVYLLAVLICAVYETWVPERVGPLRVLPYWSIALAGALAGGAAFVTSRFGGSSAQGPRRIAIGLGLSALLLVAFTGTVSGRDSARPAFEGAGSVAGGLSDSARATYEWIDANLPADSVVLANGYTEGALGMLSGRTGWLDGRTPFVQPDPWRSDAMTALIDARAYFKTADGDLLAPEVDHVVVAESSVNLGGSHFPTDGTALAEARHLALLQSFRDVLIYRVKR